MFYIFKNLCYKEPSIITRRPDKRTGKIYQSMSFKTRNLDCFNEYHDIFYVKRLDKLGFLKIVPASINDLTPISLAHWVMGDGYLTVDKTIMLCTESFNENDVNLLITVLKEKFLIHSTKSKRSSKLNSGWRIIISRKSVDKLVLLIKPHVIEELLYKLNY